MPADVIVAVSDCGSNAALPYKGNIVCCVEGCWMPADFIIAVMVRCYIKAIQSGVLKAVGCLLTFL